ncbi:MAG: ribosomal protein L4/L1e [Gemmatimonadetes bacterium]|nr:ribosomal protein L4/L1e [Gemmatimonadota bacterium]
MADNTNFEAAAYTSKGTAREKIALPESLFDGTVNMPVMHQAVKTYLANQRQGNASTKVRKYVVGGNQKPWKQKGTGRARQGSTRAPHFVGGGTVFGPLPKSYAQFLPRQQRALAKKSAFNARAREGAIIVIDRFENDAPKTKSLLALVARIGVEDKKVLILTDGVKPNLFMSSRNLPTVHVMPYADASTYHILWSDVVLVEGSAIGQSMDPVAETAAEPTVKKTKAPQAEAAPKKSAAKKAAPASAKKSPAKSAAKKSTTKTAAKKPASKKSKG